MEKVKQIYFHVGTGKTGTTFLQYRAFPYFKEIKYIQRTKYNKAIELIENGSELRYLVSREFDQQLEEEVKKFSAKLPNTTPIIVFRKHESYLASQYRRFVKNGFTGELTDFFDVENDNGYFKKIDFDYLRMIKILEDNFEQKPLVLFYEDMRKDSNAFISRLAELIGARVDTHTLDLTTKHSSYSEKQLKFIKACGRYIDLLKQEKFKNKPLQFVYKLGREAIRYSLLYIANIIPSTWLNKAPLIDPMELEKVSAYYNEDWKGCKAYANQA